MLTPQAVRRVSPGFLIGGGLTLAAAGYTVVGQVGGDSSVTVVVVGLSVAFAGLLPVSTVGVDIVVAAAPPERTGAASAISETTQELGTALGIALLGSLATAVYRAQVTQAIPTGVPRGAAEATQDTLGGATSAANQLPAALLAKATEAFTAGLQVAALTSAITLAGMATVAMILLRHIRTDLPMTDQTQDPM